jgi:hypothetical protein
VTVKIEITPNATNAILNLIWKRNSVSVPKIPTAKYASIAMEPTNTSLSAAILMVKTKTKTPAMTAREFIKKPNIVYAKNTLTGKSARTVLVKIKTISHVATFSGRTNFAPSATTVNICKRTPNFANAKPTPLPIKCAWTVLVKTKTTFYAATFSARTKTGPSVTTVKICIKTPNSANAKPTLTKNYAKTVPVKIKTTFYAATNKGKIN